MPGPLPVAQAAGTLCEAEGDGGEALVVETAMAEAQLPAIEPRVVGVRPPRPNLYEYPYSMWRQCPDWKRLWQNTAVLFGAGFAALGVLELLPEETTAWNKKEMAHVPFFRRWYDHVKAGPVWDSDLPLFNYILHPYAGAAYYMAGRSQGLSILGAFVYGSFISTIFWEYGIESFNEVPSIQDLILTPIGGLVVGELFYIAKRRIVEQDYCLLGSPVLGNIVAVLIDPANEVLGLFFGNSARQLVKWRKAQADARARAALPFEVSSGFGAVAAGPATGWGFSLRAVF